jgi:hypothetical protein
MSYLYFLFQPTFDFDTWIRGLFEAFPGSSYVSEHAAHARSFGVQPLEECTGLDTKPVDRYLRARTDEAEMKRNLGPTTTLVVRASSGADIPGWVSQKGLLLSSIEAHRKVMDPIWYFIERTAEPDRRERCIGTPVGNVTRAYLLANHRSPVVVDQWLDMLFAQFPGSEILLEDRFAPQIATANRNVEKLRREGKPADGALHVLEQLERYRREQYPSKKIAVRVTPQDQLIGSVNPYAILWSTKGGTINDLAVMTLIDFVKERSEFTRVEFDIDPN